MLNGVLLMSFHRHSTSIDDLVKGANQLDTTVFSSFIHICQTTILEVLKDWSISWQIHLHSFTFFSCPGSSIPTPCQDSPLILKYNPLILKYNPLISTYNPLILTYNQITSTFCSALKILHYGGYIRIAGGCLGNMEVIQDRGGYI